MVMDGNFLSNCMNLVCYFLKKTSGLCVLVINTGLIFLEVLSIVTKRMIGVHVMQILGT